jgi:glycosyltransferase involved in cell wall biosynthesis
MELSVIIPAYNAERSIVALLEEVRRQAGADCEIIVVDDGSTDGTAALAAGANVRCLQQVNQGPAAARNHGARVAHGDILLFLDSDLVPAVHFVERILAPFADLSIAAVQGTMKSGQTELVPRYCQAEIDYKQLRCRRQRFVDSIAAGIFAIRRSVYREYGGFCTQFRMAAAEDTDLSYRIAHDGRRILFCPEAYAHHPQPGSVRSYVRLKFWRGYWRALLYKRHPTKVIQDSYTSHMQKLQVAGAALVFVWLPIVWWFTGVVGAGLVVVLISLTTLPAMIGISRLAGWRTAAVTPFMQFAASWALGLGLVAGTTREVLARGRGAGARAGA